MGTPVDWGLSLGSRGVPCIPTKFAVLPKETFSENRKLSTQLGEHTGEGALPLGQEQVPSDTGLDTG